MKVCLLISLFITTLLVVSCEQPAPEVKLKKADYKLIDSLVIVKKNQLNKDIDSICKYMETDFYDHAVDSITLIRLEYIMKSLHE